MRSIGRYSLVAVVDTDEFLIPKKHKSLISMVESDPNYDEYNFLVIIALFLIHYEKNTVIT